MNHFHLAPRRCLLRMIAWFFLVNAVVSSLVVCGYLALLPSLHQVPGASAGSNLFGTVFFFQGFLPKFACVNLPVRRCVR